MRPSLPEVFYRSNLPAAADSVCADLATIMAAQADLARDSSYEVALGGSRCHEILYAPDGNEIWIQLRASELTIAVRYYPQAGDLESPTDGSRALADSAVEILKSRFPDVVVERATEKY